MNMASQSNKPVIKHKKYLIALEETHSVIALITGILILFITLGAIFYMIEITTEEENSLHYFTVLSNLLSACGATFMVPFAVEGIRKKRFRHTAESGLNPIKFSCLPGKCVA